MRLLLWLDNCGMCWALSCHSYLEHISLNKVLLLVENHLTQLLCRDVKRSKRCVYPCHKQTNMKYYELHLPSVSRMQSANIASPPWGGVWEAECGSESFTNILVIQCYTYCNELLFCCLPLVLLLRRKQARPFWWHPASMKHVAWSTDYVCYVFLGYFLHKYNTWGCRLKKNQHTKIAFELKQQVWCSVLLFSLLTIAGSNYHTAKNSLRESEILAVLRKIRAIVSDLKRVDRASNLLF